MLTQFLMRQVERPFEIAGARMEPGQNLMFLYHSANHDEARVPRPGPLRHLTPPPADPVFLGYGPHSRLGVNVARLEGRVCLEELLACAPRHAVDEAGAERPRHRVRPGLAGSSPIVFGS
ncbi:MAG: hypothetical protein R3F35_03780 [Myxococcota bacterium]